MAVKLSSMSFLRTLVFRSKGQGSEVVKIYLLQLVTIAVGFLTSVLIARKLGPEQKGFFDLYNTILAFVSDVSMVGVGSAAFYFFTTKRICFGVVYSSSVLLVLISSSLLLILLSAVFFFVPSVLPAVIRPWMLSAILVATYLSTHSQVWSNLIVGLGKTIDIYKVNLLNSLLLLFVFFFLAFVCSLTVENVILSCIAVGSLMLCIQLCIVKRGVGFSFLPDRSLLMPMVKWGGVAYVGAVINTLHFKIDIFMVERLCSVGAVGVYTIAVRLAEMMFILDAAVIHTSLKKIATLDCADSIKYTAKVSLVLLAVMTSVSIVAAVVGYYFIPILYGQSFDGAVKPFMFILPGIVLWASAKPMSGYICYKHGAPFVSSCFALLGAILNIFLNYILLPIYGFSGAAIASSCSYAVVALLHLIFFMVIAKRFNLFCELS